VDKDKAKNLILNNSDPKEEL